MNETYGLYNADKVVVTGGSAGGIATFLWTDYIYERSKNKQVFSVPDSGLFLTAYANPKTGAPILQPRISALFDLVNSETPIPLTACYNDLRSNIACMNFSTTAKYFKAPLFIIESAYDEYSLSVILTERCLKAGKHGAYSLDGCNETAMGEIAAYRNATLEAIENFTTLERFGAWVPACVQHGFANEEGVWSGQGYKVPGGTGEGLAKAIEGWIGGRGEGNVHVDEVEWPGNQGCSEHVGGGLRRVTEEFERLLGLKVR